ncbi:MAG: nitroreductase family protein [Lachnospiraceae bacterium]|nr:nitroreductase family protein [Lachnospiraceae bacterium]
MELLEVMRGRHSVRKYLNRPIEQEKRETIDSFVESVCNESGLSIQVFYDEPDCFRSFFTHYGFFSNVRNYIAIVGNDEDQEKAGYFGEKVVIRCQELGLNTCWVGITHGKSKAVIGEGQKLLIIISLGYGKNQGTPHRNKPLEKLCRADEQCQWFQTGMDAVLLAPTAFNQQKYFFELKQGVVTTKALKGPYSKMDLGIVKYHFEAVTGHKVK